MVETRPDRHGLVQWSSGSDSGSRLDFNEAFGKLNNQAAYDDGDTLAALPVTALVDARYVLVAAGAYRTLYRRSDTNTWDAIGGNTMPRAFTYRALEGQARTDTALTFSHPDSASPGATVGYDGSSLWTGTVRVHDANDVARGALMVGTAAGIGLTTLGRVHVRTRATGERGIVVRPYTPVDPDVGSGPLFVAQVAGGSDVLTIDALGSLRALAPSAFGGGAVGTSALVVAPTSASADGQVNGLLLYGQSAVGATGKDILRVWRDAADTNPILAIGRDSMQVGRLPWTSARTTGLLTIAANSVTSRASGWADNTKWFEWRSSDPTDPGAEANPALDLVQMTLGPSGLGVRLPTFISQRNRVGFPTLSLYRVTDFTSTFLDLARIVPDGVGGETQQIASSWDSDGRLRTGAWWKSTGTIRDARQPLKHVCKKRFTPLNGAIFSGQFISHGNSYSYTWPVMTAHSSGVADLDIVTIVETMTTQTGTQSDANSYLVETSIAVNGGSFTVLDGDENVPTTTSNARRAAGDSLYVNHRLLNLPAGATFQVKTRVAVGSTSDPDMWLRTLDVNVAEVLLSSYSPLP